MPTKDRRPRAFKVTIGVDENGTHTVFSTTEPVFCFVRNSEEEALAVASTTIRDYVQRFGRPEPTRGERMPTSVNLRSLVATRELEVA